ncbi:rhomboid-related protein 2-like [Bradysia coprophila]|uniref:rhomboid-related protein 2-like n=1 Tax=Bradysia coprophila TaxID=38358 RepID=UPI00187DC895|nr:rhomboid-related protein 2-like [Bradysia coprophila]
MDPYRSEAEAAPPTPKWKRLLRQNSEKIGTFAEDVVLPPNQRSGQRAPLPEVILMRDVEAQNSSMVTMVIIDQSPQKQSKHFPSFIVGISIIQVFLMYNVNNQDLLINLGYDPHRRHELWRLVTIMFVHIGLHHLWSNVIFQLILGIPLEIVHNWRRISIIYIASVVGGTLFITVLSPRTYTAGASAAVYGLLFSHLSTIILNWNEMDRKCCRLFWLLAYMSFDIGFSIFYALEKNHEGSDISHAAHFGGAVTGFLVSILVLKNFQSHPWEEKMQKICLTILKVLAVTILIVNIVVWGLYLPEEWNFNYRNSLQVYLKKIIVESSNKSQIHKKCIRDLDCKSILDQYAFNGTISNISLE